MVVGKFDVVHVALCELQESSQATKGNAENQIDQAANDIRINESQIEGVMDQMRLGKEDKAEAIEHLKREQRIFEELMKENPSKPPEVPWYKQLIGGIGTVAKAVSLPLVAAAPVVGLTTATLGSVALGGLEDVGKVDKKTHKELEAEVSLQGKKMAEIKAAIAETRKRIETAQKQEQESMKKKRELLNTMANLKLQKVSQEKAKEVLTDALKVFGELKAQWVLLLAYFSHVSNLIVDSMNKPLEDYRTKGENYLEKVMAGKKLTKLQKKKLPETGEKAMKAAFEVFCNAKTYKEISGEHFLPMLTDLGKFAALDKDQDAKEIERNQKAVAARATEVQKAIEATIDQHWTDLDQKFLHASKALKHDN